MFKILMLSRITIIFTTLVNNTDNVHVDDLTYYLFLKNQYIWPIVSLALVSLEMLPKHGNDIRISNLETVITASFSKNMLPRNFVVHLSTNYVEYAFL